MLRKLIRMTMVVSPLERTIQASRRLSEMRNVLPRRFATRAPTVRSQALAPKTAWGMSMAKAVASLQEGSLLTYEPIKLKGVTFNNDDTGESRQDILDRLRKSAVSSSATGLPVLLTHEPDNPSDPDAVAVNSSLGRIGYVPRESTHLFQHACTPGYTDWIWQPIDIPGAMLGCSIVAAPALRAAFIQVVPPQLAAFIDIKRWMPEKAWERLREDTEDASLGCCQVTGLTSLPLFPDQADSEQIPSRVFPLWTLKPHTRTLTLSGCQVLSMPVIFALSLLDLTAATAPLPPPASAAPAAAAQEGVLEGLLRELAAAHGGPAAALDIARAAAVDALLCCDAWYVMGRDGELEAQHAWREEDVEGYVRQCCAARERLQTQQVGLDVSWLVAEGYVSWDDVPAPVRELQSPGDSGDGSAQE